MFHSAVLTDAATVYTWGDASSSQLGLHFRDEEGVGGRGLGAGRGGCVDIPELVRGLLGEQLCHVACGDVFFNSLDFLG